MDHIDESIQESKLERKKFLLALFRRAAIKLKNEGDPWKRYNLQNIPAERAIRHLYHPTSHTWSTDETIVKIEKRSIHTWSYAVLLSYEKTQLAAQ